jgi:hypothetical protein
MDFKETGGRVWTELVASGLGQPQDLLYKAMKLRLTKFRRIA